VKNVEFAVKFSSRLGQFTWLVRYQVSAKTKGDVAEDILLATAAAAKHTDPLERPLGGVLGKDSWGCTHPRFMQVPDFLLFHSAHHSRSSSVLDLIIKKKFSCRVRRPPDKNPQQKHRPSNEMN